MLHDLHYICVSKHLLLAEQRPSNYIISYSILTLHLQTESRTWPVWADMESVVVVILILLQCSHIASIKSAIEKVLLYDKKIVFPIKFAYQGNPTNVLCRCKLGKMQNGN